MDKCVFHQRLKQHLEHGDLRRLRRDAVKRGDAPFKARLLDADIGFDDLDLLRKWDEGVSLGRVAVDLAHGARDHGDMIDVALDGHRADQLQCVIEKMRIDLAAEHIQLRALAQHLRLIERIGFL